MFTFGVPGLLCEAPAPRKPPGFHTTAREPKRAHFRASAFKKTTKYNEKTQRERTKWRLEREKKIEILGGPAEGGGSGVRWSGAGWSRESEPTTTRNNHNHNNTNTARSGVEAKPRRSVAPKGVGGREKGPRWVGSRRVGPKGLASGLGFGYGGFGVRVRV